MNRGLETVTGRNESQGELMECIAMDPTPRVHPPTVESRADAVRRVRVDEGYLHITNGFYAKR